MPEEEKEKTQEQEIPAKEPEQETSPEGDSGNLVKVKMGEKEFLMTPDQAEALKEHDKKFARKLNETSDELGRLRNLERTFFEKDKKGADTETGTEEEDIEDLILTNPKKAVEKIETRILTNLENRQMVESERKTHQENFWNNFYTEHPELKKFEKHVKKSFTANYSKYQDLPPTSDSRDIIANDILREFTDIRDSFKTEKSGTLESTTNIIQKEVKKVQPAPKSISDLIKEKRNRMRGAVI